MIADLFDIAASVVTVTLLLSLLTVTRFLSTPAKAVRCSALRLEICVQTAKVGWCVKSIWVSDPMYFKLSYLFCTQMRQEKTARSCCHPLRGQQEEKLLT